MTVQPLQNGCFVRCAAWMLYSCCHWGQLIQIMYGNEKEQIVDLLLMKYSQ